MGALSGSTRMPDARDCVEEHDCPHTTRPLVGAEGRIERLSSLGDASRGVGRVSGDGGVDRVLDPCSELGHDVVPDQVVVLRLDL